nr:hypothetical protein B0A51_09895 [Rachicladosporium sp. CCFEE 5018]
MGNSITESSAVNANICMSEESTVFAFQVCDPQVSIPGQRTLLLDLPSELLQDIARHTDMIPSIRLVCKTLEAATLDPFADEYLSYLGCFIYDEDRWRRIKALIASRLSKKVKTIEFTSDGYEIYSVDDAPTVEEEDHVDVQPSLYLGFETLASVVAKSGARLPSSVLMSSVMRSIRDLPTHIDVDVHLAGNDVYDLDLSAFPVHREFLFAMATSRLAIHSFTFTIYNMCHLVELFEDFEEETSAMLAIVERVEVGGLCQRSSDTHDTAHAGRMDIAECILKRCGAARHVSLDLQDVKNTIGASARLLLASDFARLEEFECVAGHIDLKDLLGAFARSQVLQRVWLYNLKLDGLRDSWKKLVLGLQALSCMKSLRMTLLWDSDANVDFHDASTGAHKSEIWFDSRAQVEVGLAAMLDDGLCFGGSQVGCIGRRVIGIESRAGS